MRIIFQQIEFLFKNFITANSIPVKNGVIKPGRVKKGTDNCFKKKRASSFKSSASIKEDHDLCEIWHKLRRRYFSDLPHLDQFTIVYSTRNQKRVLGSCSLHSQRVTIAREMKHPEAQIHLEALIFHEMCHAALGIPPKKNGRRTYHGKDFYHLEAMHPGIPLLDLWMKSGGWSRVVRSTRMKDRWDKIKGQSS
jgi:hypothetical protein